MIYCPTSDEMLSCWVGISMIEMNTDICFAQILQCLDYQGLLMNPQRVHGPTPQFAGTLWMYMSNKIQDYPKGPVLLLPLAPTLFFRWLADGLEDKI